VIRRRKSRDAPALEPLVCSSMRVSSADDGFGCAVERFDVMALRAAERSLFQLLDALDHVRQRVLQHFR
jgi:hypothetical protein